MNSTGFLLLGVVLLLSVYMQLAKRSRFLPPFPLGLLIIYFAIQTIYQFIGHLPIIAEFDKGHDVVGTIRQNRQDTLFRRYASILVNKMVQQFTGVDMSDYGCMLRGYHREVVNAMLLCHERSTFIPVLANSFARNSSEIPVAHAERTLGESKYSIFNLINLQFDLLTSMTTFPLRLLSFIGGGIALLGFLFAFILLVLRLIYGSAWGVDGVFPLFSILFIFVGAQFIGIGLLGEYIGRIYHDVRARPRYFIHEIIGRD